jgi:hypothetical protein
MGREKEEIKMDYEKRQIMGGNHRIAWVIAS